jgi:hypothetical protein
LAGAAHKGKSLRILVRSGPFPDKHQARVGASIGEDDLVAALVERTARAIANVFADEAEGGFALGGGNDI